MAEPEAAGAVDVAALRTDQPADPDVTRALLRFYGPTHPVIRYLALQLLFEIGESAEACQALAASNARAERLAAAAREVLDDFARQVKEQPVMADCDPLDFYTEPMLRLRAALAGDAPGREQD